MKRKPNILAPALVLSRLSRPAMARYYYPNAGLNGRPSYLRGERDDMNNSDEMGAHHNEYLVSAKTPRLTLLI